MISLMKLVEGKYDYGCVMARIDEESSRKILDFNRKTIGEHIIYKEGDEYGREESPHITLKYGLVNGYTEEQMKKILSKVTPFHIDVKGISLFENEKFDVVKFDVDGKELRALNEIFSKLPNHDQYPEYHPHMTLAYVRKGMGRHMVKEARKIAKIPVNSIVYSNRGEKSFFDL
jgi:2'-5' RNA ligase